MKRCRTCRWWLDSKRENVYENVKECTSPKVIFTDHTSYTDDHKRLMGYEKERREPDPYSVLESDEAGVVDGSGYYAAFFPGPDFGCVNHEERT